MVPADGGDVEMVLEKEDKLQREKNQEEHGGVRTNTKARYTLP